MGAQASEDYETRYRRFVRWAVERGRVWSLRSADGWVLAGDGVDVELIPVWASARDAVACAVGPWEGAQAAEIPLDTWLSDWLPGMIDDGTQVAVFPLPGEDGVATEPGVLEAHLLEEREGV